MIKKLDGYSFCIDDNLNRYIGTTDTARAPTNSQILGVVVPGDTWYLKLFFQS